MDLNTLIIPYFLLLSLMSNNFPNKVLSTTTNCSISQCDGSSDSGPTIRFPFRVKRPGQQPDSCGEPGFDVWCDGRSKHTLIELPSSGNLRVKSIDYAAQEMWVNDPNNCLPKRLLSFNLSNSPFAGVYHQDFSFFNCSNSLNSTFNDDHTTDFTNGKGLVGPIECLSGSQHFVYAIPSKANTSNRTFLSPLNCSLIAPSVRVPVQWPPSLHNDTILSLLSDLHDDLRLSWYMPECRPCDLKGQMCASDTNSNGSKVIICSNIPNQGMVGKLPLTTFIAVILIICSPFIICVVATFIIWLRSCCRRRGSTRTLQNESSGNPGRPRHIEELGQLAEVNVEFARYLVQMGLNNEEFSPDRRPSIILSEIEEVGQGPNRENETACAICMVEYRRKDKIGTLPACGHYFHANCVNKWLLSRGRFGKTCPICRTPVDSSLS